MPSGAPVGFTFSFPVDQTSVDAGTLMEWTKGFDSPGVVGQDVMAMLAAACARRGLQVHLRALVNDTVGTLMMRAYSDAAARVGVILGTGTNACYVERAAAIPKWEGGKEGGMLVNMEWGGFGSGAYGVRAVACVGRLPFLLRAREDVSGARACLGQRAGRKRELCYARTS